MNKIHHKITEIAKKAIESMSIVFPSQYGKIYSQLAKEHNLELKTEELLAREMLDEKMIRHIISLCECTDQALDAMQTNNIEKLKVVIEETNKLREEVGELKKIVYEDSLTKSYNRKWFDDTYLAHDDNLQLRGEGTIVIIDLNHFKAINDTYGHVIGDKVLAHVALKLKETGGRVVRYGGDEFLIIFDGKNTPSEMKKRIGVLHDYWAKTSFKTEDHNFKISFSCGMAPFVNGSNIEDVISVADKAMYQQKNG
jgi:diguanylate cyclase (GGDEF)-like protein